MSKDDLIEWLYTLHNEINQTNLKPIFSAEEWSAEKAKPVDKPRLIETIAELSAHFLQNEQITHLNAGASLIWRRLAQRLFIQL